MTQAASPPNWANKLSVGIAAFALVAGVLWYVARLDARVDQIETSVTRNSAANNQSEKALTCGDVAAKVAEAYRSGDGFRVAQPLERLMDRMECSPSARHSEP